MIALSVGSWVLLGLFYLLRVTLCTCMKALLTSTPSEIVHRLMYLPGRPLVVDVRNTRACIL